MAWTAVFGSGVLAATVYKTVDENGVVSFSDTPPAQEARVEVLDIEVQTPDLSESAQDQLEAMRETTDRMVADRQQREKHRAEVRQQQVESNPQPQVVEYDAPDVYGDSYYPVYYPYPVHRPRPRPDHRLPYPPLRPTQPPAAGVISPGHDYPASLIRRGYSPQVRAALEN